MLFRSDPGELSSVAADQSAICDQLLGQLTTWRTTVDAELMRPNPNWDPAAAAKKRRKGSKQNVE